MYKQLTNIDKTVSNSYICRISDGAWIPFHADNTDYQKFKYDAEHGAVVQDATGRSMTAQEITTLLGTLP